MMKRLSQHIEYLLHTRGELVLPGVGSFHVLPKPAYFDRATGIFFPPSRVIVFNGGEKEDDGALFDSYQRREGLTYNETYSLLSKDLEALSSMLESGNDFDIPGVGSLRMEGGLPSLNYEKTAHSLEEFGLGAVEVKRGRKKKNGERVFNPDYYYVPIHKKFARVAASFLLVAVVGLFTILPLRNGTNSISTASIVPVKTEKAVETTKTLAPEETAKVVCSIEEPAETKEDRFFLIVASFRTPQEAEKFIKIHEDKDMVLKTIEGERYFWVSAMSAPTKEEVTAFRKSEKFKTSGLSSWILDKEKK